MRQRGDVLSGGSFASSSDPRVLFGLGDATSIDQVEVVWPDGKRQKLSIPLIDSIYTVDRLEGIKDVYTPKKSNLP